MSSDDEVTVATEEAEFNQKMYQRLKRLWMGSAQVSQEDPTQADRDFETFIGNLIAMNQSGEDDEEEPEEHVHAEPPVTRMQMMLDTIIELETAVTMVPPRVKAYRDLLAAAGLDKAAQSPGDDDTDTMKGLPGINLADQAALEFHSNLLNLAFSIAQEEVMDKARRKQEAQAQEAENQDD